jgi:hypothetical protein
VVSSYPAAAGKLAVACPCSAAAALHHRPSLPSR